MYKNIEIRDKKISVKFQPNKIAIINDEQLSALVTKMPEDATDELVSSIKKEFNTQYHTDFKVGDSSLAVEIWGHVFAEKFAEAIKKISPIRFVDSLAEKISKHCDVINIGEKGYDDNRFVWDALSPFKPVIAAVLRHSD